MSGPLVANSPDIHLRMLEKLQSLNVHLLGECLLGRDFFPSGDRIHQARECGGSVNYVLSDRVTSFYPVLVGSVKSINQRGTGFGIHVELELPQHPSNRMDVFYWNQFATLQAIIDSDSHAGAEKTTFHAIIPWCTGSCDGLDFDRRAINLNVTSEVQIRMSTAHTLTMGTYRARSSSLSSNSSSSTLSSDEEHHPSPPASVRQTFVSAYQADPVISLRDMIVARCELTCRDFPRITRHGEPAITRIYSISAITVDILI